VHELLIVAATFGFFLIALFLLLSAPLADEVGEQ
jgi:hypothetical protein